MLKNKSIFIKENSLEVDQESQTSHIIENKNVLTSIIVEIKIMIAFKINEDGPFA